MGIVTSSSGSWDVGGWRKPGVPQLPRPVPGLGHAGTRWSQRRWPEEPLAPHSLLHPMLMDCGIAAPLGYFALLYRKQYLSV